MLREEIEDLKRGVMVMEKEVREQTLAIELLHEVKKASKRWFVISIILLIALVGTNAGWLIYESQWDYVAEDTTQSIEDIENPSNTNFTQHID